MTSDYRCFQAFTWI